MMRTWLVTVVVVASVSAALGPGCGGTDGATPAGGTGAGSSSGSAAGGSSGGDGLPCDVYQVLQDSCLSCHGSPLIGGATKPLLTYADLQAPSAVEPGKKVGEACADRMANGTMPPAPAAHTTAAQNQVFSDWVAAGMPMGSCGDAGAPDTTFDGPPSCQSGMFHVGHEGTDMRPGEACNACHSMQAGEQPPIFTFAGTVFAEGHAQDHCLPTADEQAKLEQAQVVIIGADNAQLTLSLTTTQGFQNGNFSTSKVMKLPYTAKVVYMGKERVMSTPQMSGDCNTCHTVAGANGAPGRITLPQ